MRLSKRSYPHPVVGNADDVPGFGFQVTTTRHRRGGDWVLEVVVQSSCPSLNRLVAKGAAVFTLHVECGRTLYRQAFPSADRTWQAVIPADQLTGTVEVCPFAVATKPVRRYRVDGANPRYGDATFAVESGDVLAVDEMRPMHLDDRDPLRRIGSIFQVERAAEPGDRPVDANFGGGKILVTLSQPDADRYALLAAGDALKSLLATAFILPVLVRAVGLLADDPSRADDCNWAAVVARRMDELGLDMADPLRAAQVLYGLPVTRAFQSAQGLFDTAD